MAPAIGAVKQRAAGARKHTPAGTAVASAQAAALQPGTEQKRSAATATVNNLNAAKDGSKQVARETFKSAFKKAIEAATPKPTTEAEADKVVSSGAKTASTTMQGQLATQKDAAVGPLKNPAAAEVPPGQIPAAPEKPLKPEEAGPRPAPVSAAPVVPPPLPAQRLDYSEDRAPTDKAMAENDVKKEQLEKGNEPAFGQTLQARSTAEQHEAQAEAKYRKAEGNVQANAERQAQGALAKGLGDVHGARTAAIGKVAGQQTGTKAKDQAERQRITETIDGIKKQTRTDVETILKEMEADASRIFGEGLAAAETAYRNTFEEEKGGIGTWLTTWGDDWKELIESSLGKARREYLRQVDLAIDKVADCVDAKLEAAKKRVAEGRTQVETFVNGLGASVKRYGEEALASVSADFDAMASMIDERKDALIDNLTSQFKASYERMSAMEEELRSANKSLWERVYDATVGLIKKIIAFKDMLLGILAKAADVITDIISDPIGFLGNLVSGVMLGLKNFMGNIGSHLKKGLMDWLFGALGGAGLVMPDTLDLKGIVSIVLQVLGLTYANFRARAVKIVGEPVVSALEKAAEVFKVIVTEGIPGLWRFIKEKVEDLKSMVLDAIFDFIKEKVIIAGVTWVIGLLNPASAFFKACKAIYDIVMFFINRGSQILALVNAVIDSMAAIAKGSIGVAATFVENALAKAIPVAIGFLASLLGLGDISGTIRKTIEKAQAPINKAIDWVINQAVKLVKAAGKLIGGLLGGKKDEKKEAKEKPGADLNDAQAAAAGMLAKRLGDSTSEKEAGTVVPAVRGELGPMGLKSLELQRGTVPGEFEIYAEASPKRRIAKLIKKRITVAVSATITMKKDKAPLEGLSRPKGPGPHDSAENITFLSMGKEREEALGGKGRAATLPPVLQPPGTPARKGSQPSGGVIVEPAEGSSTLEVLAWNTSAPEKGHNVSHAERQFIDWFEDRPALWKRNVQSVHIQVVGRPVCDLCEADLKGLRTRFPGITFTWGANAPEKTEDLETQMT